MEQGEQATATFHRAVYPAIDPAGSLKHSAGGLHVVITGAAGGIGRALAVTYARAAAASLFLIDLGHQGLAETGRQVAKAAPTCSCFQYAADLTSTGIADTLAHLLEDAEGKVDVLINNAGILDSSSVADSDPSRWWHVWEVNLRATYTVTRRLLPCMLAAQKATIICVSSMQGLVTRPGESAYGGSKTAVTRFVDFLDAEHSAQGIRAFAIHPGGVATELALQTPKETHYLLVDPPELAGACCLWLCTDKADFLKGRFVRANWDVEELQARADEIVRDDLLKLRLRV